MLRKTILSVLVLAASVTAAAAQEVEVEKYNITARIDLGQSALDVRAAVTISNLSQTPKSRLYFRLTRQAKINTASVGGTQAQFETTEDRRVATLNQVTLTPASPLGGGANTTVELAYRIEAPESNTLIAVYPGEVLLSPESIWVPMPSTPFTLYGATTAPFTLTVNPPAGVADFGVASAGLLKGDSGKSSFLFEQPLNCIPFFLAGPFGQPDVSESGGVRIEVWKQPGIGGISSDRSSGAASSANTDSSAASQVRRMIEEARQIVAFFTKTFGPPPAGASFRIISAFRTGNIIVPGALVLNQQVFRQDALDATSIELLADAISRLWIDGRVRVRGRDARTAQADRPGQKGVTSSLLHETVPRYLAVLYIEDRYGKEAASEAFDRMRSIYTPVAQSKRDAELWVQTPLLPTYSASLLAKGPLLLRLIGEATGREKLLDGIKSVMTGPQNRIVTFDDIRAAIVKSSGPANEKLFSQWVDSVIEPDILIGLPQPGEKPGTQVVNLRNLGTGDLDVPIVAVTASGKRIVTSARVPSEDLASATIETAEKIISVEADPEKFIIQANYDNDAKPVRSSSQTLFNESLNAFNKGDFAQAETKLREAAKLSPQNALIKSWLARTLAAQKKNDEANAAANEALKVRPSITGAMAWAHLVLGQIALEKGNAAEAFDHLRKAVIEATDAPAQTASREALIKAGKTAAKLPPAEEAVRNYIAQFDVMVKQPSSDKLFSIVSKNNLKRFVQGLTITPPTAWTTEILRVDRIDSRRVSVDVALRVTAGGREASGTALYVLFDTGSGLILEQVPLFNVKEPAQESK